MKNSEILREAKKYLWDGRYELMLGQRIYVCHCISKVNTWPSNIYALEDWILKLLENHSALERWLAEHHPSFIQSDSNMQKLRRKWMDWMIRYWEIKETENKHEQHN